MRVKALSDSSRVGDDLGDDLPADFKTIMQGLGCRVKPYTLNPTTADHFQWDLGCVRLELVGPRQNNIAKICENVLGTGRKALPRVCCCVVFLLFWFVCLS